MRYSLMMIMQDCSSDQSEPWGRFGAFKVWREIENTMLTSFYLYGVPRSYSKRRDCNPSSKPVIIHPLT